jgi:hypothetical protein
MRHFNRPVTIQELTNYIAETHRVRGKVSKHFEKALKPFLFWQTNPEAIKDPINYIIESGVEIGFLIKYDAEYVFNPELQMSESCQPLSRDIEENGKDEACVNTPRRSARIMKRRIVNKTGSKISKESPSKKTKQSKNWIRCWKNQSKIWQNCQLNKTNSVFSYSLNIYILKQIISGKRANISNSKTTRFPHR